MKAFWFGVLAFVLTVPALGAPREIVLKVEKGADSKTHWMPEKVEVTQGETVKIVAKYETKGAYEFHGLYIPELKIKEEVMLNKPVEITKTIPADLKPGEYKIACHLHGTHLPATLVVKAAEKK